jgi:hypothetical protein
MQILGRGNPSTRARTLVLALILACGVAVAAVSSGAPAAKPDFTGLDVVILIDQSASMWGVRANDKWGHRIGQTKNIIYRLAEDVEGTSFVHRVSVVNFGDKASAAFPAPLVLRYNPADPGNTLREAKALVERYVTAQNLQNTNTPEALELCSKELERMASSEPVDGRRRVVLLLTDGRPDLPGSGSSLDDLRNQISRQADALKSRDVGIWVVGLNDVDNYWNQGDGDFWEKITGAGRARLAETASTNISSLVQEIVNEWLEVRGTPIGKEYECPPYLRRIVFNINFGLPRSDVSVSDQDGREIPLSSGGSASAPGTFARFIVDDPPPGIYRIKQDPSRSYSNFVETLSPEVKRLSPGAGTSLEAEARIVFQASDSKGQPLEILPDWPINASIVIGQPSAAPVEIPATFKGEGKFEAKWKPPALGVYSARLKGLVTLKSGATFDVFGSSAHSYNEQLEVNDSHPYWLQMNAPDPAQGLRVMPGQASARVEFALLDSKKEKVANPASVVKDPATWLKLQVIDKSGVPLAAPVPLQPTPTGTFEASVPVSLNWKAGEGWWTPGRLNLRVIAEPERLPVNNFLDSIALTEETETKRVGDDRMTVGAVDIRYPWWLLGLALLLILLLVLAVVLILLRRLIPGVLMWWIDSSRRRLVELKLYDGDTDPAGDSAKKYPAGGWHEFKYDRQVSVSVDGQEIVATLFRVRRVLSPDEIRAEVEYSWQNDPQKKKHRSIITKGRAERLRGLPAGGYLLRLDVKQ